VRAESVTVNVPACLPLSSSAVTWKPKRVRPANVTVTVTFTSCPGV
jgi:hypothetical protein